MNKQSVLAAAAIERMMDAHQSIAGDVVIWHTVAEIASRAKVSTAKAISGIPVLMDHGTISKRVNRGVAEYRIHPEIRFGITDA